MDTGKVVVHEMQGDRVFQILYFLGESVGKPGEATVKARFVALVKQTKANLFVGENLTPEQAEERVNEVIAIAISRARSWLSLPDRIASDGEPYYLLAAHFIALDNGAVNGSTQFGTATNASVGSVSVGMATPPVKTAWQAWLAGTPYGQQLWAWLALKAAGAWAVGGLPEREGFRKVGGVFW